MIECRRCGKPCIGAPQKNSKARPFRKAPKGLCAACAVCSFFQHANGDRGIGFALPANFDPEGLRLPHIQKQFERVLAVGCSELTMDQIDWDEVIQKWDLSPGRCKTE